MKCKNCGCEDFTIMTSMIVSMPLNMYYKLTKKKMRQKDFEVWSVNWDQADFICKKCGSVILRADEEHKLTDAEERIFLAAMGRERKVCREIDKEDDDPSRMLVPVVDSIEKKVKKFLFGQRGRLK